METGLGITGYRWSTVWPWHIPADRNAIKSVERNRTMALGRARKKERNNLSFQATQTKSTELDLDSLQVLNPAYQGILLHVVFLCKQADNPVAMDKSFHQLIISHSFEEFHHQFG